MDVMSYSAYLIFREANKLQGNKNVKSGLSEENPDSVTRAGVEPARVAPLVFETSASTDSAIWALRRCKGKSI